MSCQRAWKKAYYRFFDFSGGKRRVEDGKTPLTIGLRGIGKRMKITFWKKGYFEQAVKILGIALGLGAVAVFSLYVYRLAPRHICEIDTQGYFLMGQSFSEGRMPRWPDDPFRYGHCAYVGVGGSGAEVMPKYTPGWPLCLAAGYLVAGPSGALRVNIVLAAVGALFFLLLALQWFDSFTAFALTVVWLFSPQLMGYAGYPLAHGPCIAFVLAAFFFTLRWAARGGFFCALMGGFCAAMIPMIRPTGVLIWPALGLAALVSRMEAASEARRRAASEPQIAVAGRKRRGLVVAYVAAYALAALVPLLFWLWYNQVNFGSPFRTGYDLTGEQSAFNFGILLERLPHVAPKRLILFDEPVWILAGLGFLFGLARRPLRALVCLLWLAPVSLLYMAYYYFHLDMKEAYTRFFLCAMPAVVLSAGFLTVGLGRFVIARIVLVALLIWMGAAPPRRFLNCARSLRNPDRDATAEALKEFLDDKTDVYAENWIAWQASLFPGVRGYPFIAWMGGGVFSEHGVMKQSEGIAVLPERMMPYADEARLQSMNDRYGRIGRADLRAEFLDRVAVALEEGRRVLVVGRQQTPVLWWLREERAFSMESVGTGAGGVGLWQVKFAGEAD